MKKKILKTGMVLSVFCVMMMGLVSCEGKDESLQLYTIICRVSGSSYTVGGVTVDERQQLVDYLKSKGYSTKAIDFTYTGAASETDVLATKRFDDYLLNVSRDEIAALGLKPTAYITFILSRADVESVDLAVWESKTK